MYCIELCPFCQYTLDTISSTCRHCCTVLGYALFAKAYDLLDQTDDNMELEVSLRPFSDPRTVFFYKYCGRCIGLLALQEAYHVMGGYDGDDEELGMRV